MKAPEARLGGPAGGDGDKEPTGGGAETEAPKQLIALTRSTQVPGPLTLSLGGDRPAGKPLAQTVGCRTVPREPTAVIAGFQVNRESARSCVGVEGRAG